MVNPPLMTGVDLVDVERLAGMISQSGPEFLEAGWTALELRECGAEPARLAARWAAKEATMKALGVGIGTISPLDIEVLTLPSGAPTLRVTGSALARAEELQVAHWSLALSHETRFAVAFVVALAGGSVDV